MLENIRNAITRQPMEWLERNVGGRIPSRSQHVRHDAVVMANQRRIEHSAVMSVWTLEAERVNQFW